MLPTGSSNALFDFVYRDVFPIIYRVTARITGSGEAAEEICQEAFVRYLRHQHELSDEQSARYWLIRVAKNLAFNRVKRSARERRAYERLLNDTSGDAGDSVTRPLDRQNTQEAVQIAIQRLPLDAREIIVMREYGGLSYREIAAVLGTTEGTVKVRAYRARKKLAVILGDLGYAEG